MGNIVLFIIEWAFALLVLLAVYKAVLSGTTLHRFNRFYLLGATLLSALLPLVHVTIPDRSPLVNSLSIEETEFAQELSGTFMFMDEPQMPDMVISDETSASGISLWAVALICTYAAYVLTLIIGWTSGIIRARRFLRGKPRRHLSRTVWLVMHDDSYGPFSWMNYIVISDKESGFARLASLRHEYSHVRLMHSVDLIILLACTIFNPVCWLVLKEIKIVHEFEADDEVINRYGIREQDYQRLLLIRAVGAEAYALASSFNLNIKKRIIMMNKKKTLKRRLIWLLLLVPMLGMTSVLFAHTEEAVIIENDLQPTVEITDQADDVKYYCSLVLRIRREAILANKLLYDPKTGNDIATPREEEGGTLLGVISALEQYMDKIEADGDVKVARVELTLDSNADERFVREVEGVLRNRGITRIIYAFGNNTRGVSIKVSGERPEAGGMIRGVVKDAEGPMMLVNVTERDPSNRIVSHALTDMNGEFAMRVVNPDNTLIISTSGYYRASTPITGNEFDVTMVQDRGAQQPASHPIASVPDPSSGVLRSLSVEEMEYKPKSGDIISGTINAANGLISMANVYEADAEGKIVAHSVTDQYGNFSFRLVNPNNHLVVKYPGYNTVEKKFTSLKYIITLEQQ